MNFLQAHPVSCCPHLLKASLTQELAQWPTTSLVFAAVSLNDKCRPLYVQVTPTQGFTHDAIS